MNLKQALRQIIKPRDAFTLQDLIHAEPCMKEFVPLMKFMGIDIDPNDIQVIRGEDIADCVGYNDTLFKPYAHYIITRDDVMHATGSTLQGLCNVVWCRDHNLLPPL